MSVIIALSDGNDDVVRQAWELIHDEDQTLHSEWQCLVSNWVYLLPEESSQLDKLSEMWRKWKDGDSGGVTSSTPEEVIMQLRLSLDVFDQRVRVTFEHKQWGAALCASNGRDFRLRRAPKSKPEEQDAAGLDQESKGRLDFGEAEWLHKAAHMGNESLVRYLLSHNADPNHLAELGTGGSKSALVLAAEKGHVGVAKALIEAKCDLKLETFGKSTALLRAAHYGHLEVCRVLVEAGANANHFNELGCTGLHDAACEMQLDCIRYLVEDAGMDVNIRNTHVCGMHCRLDDNIVRRTWTPMHYAANSGSVDAVRLLVELGGDPNARDTEFRSPLSISTMFGRVECIEYLRSLPNIEDGSLAKHRFKYQSDFDENGFLFFIGTKAHQQPYTNPCLAGDVVVRTSVKTGHSNAEPYCAVGREAANLFLNGWPRPADGAEKLTSWPVSAGPWFEIDLCGRKIAPTHYTLRHYSLWAGNAMRSWTLQGASHRPHSNRSSDADAEKQDGGGGDGGGDEWVTLSVHTDDVSLNEAGASHTWAIPPIVYGSDSSEQKQTDMNPARHDNRSEFYSRFRVVMTGVDSVGEAAVMALSGFEIYGTVHLPVDTPLHIAAQCGHLAIVESLIAEEAQHVDTRGRLGRTPLHAACATGRIKVAELLVAHGADIDVLDENGSSPLLLAALGGHRKCSMFLLAQDANISIQNKDGISVLDGAAVMAESGDDAVFEIIKKSFFVENALFIKNEQLSNFRPLGAGNFARTCVGEFRVRDAGARVQVLDREGTAKAVILHDAVRVPVVCKVPKLGGSQDDWHELAVLQNVPNHRNLLNLLGICLDFRFEGQTILCIVVPLKQGGSMNSFVRKRGPLPRRELLKFGMDIVKAADHMHKHRYVHNDIALRNVLLEGSSDERAVLSDFGLSRPFESPAKLGLMPWRHAAPETLQSGGATMSPLTDVWMIGITLWEMQTVHTMPYLHIGDPKTLFAAINAASRHIDSADAAKSSNLQATSAPLIFSPRCPDEWKEVIYRCCQVNPERRFQSATEVLEALKQLESDGFATADNDALPSDDCASAEEQHATEYEPIVSEYGDEDTIAASYYTDDIDGDLAESSKRVAAGAETVCDYLTEAEYDNYVSLEEYSAVPSDLSADTAPDDNA